MIKEGKMYRPLDAMTYPRFEGIRTFMRLPYITDLTGVDFAVVGTPFDTGGTFRVGARFGPEGIRQHSVLLRPYHPEHNIAIFDHCSGVDYGDLPVTPGYLPESHQQIETGARKLFTAGVTPIFLGGDHSVSLPLLRAAAATHGPVALIQFDSHGDLWPGYFGGKDTHGTPFRRAVEEGLLDCGRSCQIGLRGSVYDAGDVEMSRALFEVVTAAELHQIGIPETLRRIQQRVGSGPAYLTFDIDFVDPAYAPGTGTPEVGGFTGADCLQLLRGLTGINFVGFDMVEVMPAYDPANVTSLLAANIVYEFMALIALHKA
ncbi:MAG: agmatinase [Chloroflexi bacterium]|nr:agmatinase [Chloroflexota bacterium]